MEANKVPEKIYIHEASTHELTEKLPYHVEYVRTDVFIDRIINFLNYKLDDIVVIRVPGTIIPHHVAKQDLIEDLRKYMKG